MPVSLTTYYSQYTEIARREHFGSDGPKGMRMSYEDFYPGQQELTGDEADQVVGRLTDLIVRFPIAVALSSCTPASKAMLADRATSLLPLQGSPRRSLH